MAVYKKRQSLTQLQKYSIYIQLFLSCKGSARVLQMQKKIKGHSEPCETSIPSGSFVIDVNAKYPAFCDKNNKQYEKSFEGIFGTIGR